MLCVPWRWIVGREGPIATDSALAGMLAGGENRPSPETSSKNRNRIQSQRAARPDLPQPRATKSPCLSIDLHTSTVLLATVSTVLTFWAYSSVFRMIILNKNIFTEASERQNGTKAPFPFIAESFRKPPFEMRKNKTTTRLLYNRTGPR